MPTSHIPDSPALARALSRQADDVEHDAGLIVERLAWTPEQRLAANAAFLRLYFSVRPFGPLVSEEQRALPVLQAEALFACLARHGVDYVLIGGLAAVLHGSPLPTVDADICPAADPENLRRLMPIQDVPVRVAALEDIIRSKSAANRPKDQRALPILRLLLEEIRRRR